MLYLRKFNENVEWSKLDLQELEDFCETYLAYLLDDGFGVRVTRLSTVNRHGSNKYRARIEFYKEDPHLPIPFEWDDIKDYFIPFYQMLSKDYDISITPNRELVSDTYGGYVVRNCAVKFDYRMPGRQLWETESRWFTEEEIVNDKIYDKNTLLGSHIGVISIYLNR